MNIESQCRSIQHSSSFDVMGIVVYDKDTMRRSKIRNDTYEMVRR